MILSEWFTPAGALAVLHPADGFVFLALHTGVVGGLTALVAAATIFFLAITAWLYPGVITLITNLQHNRI
jgi:hypothetical protein